ncbi:hypothetical protein V1525DRAFT_432612 [Lipomyces kononenkoae]|uniref:Uncharacterized protein n=1 Tax=Lipomyces kononenkoae TaxID=34357 RepID=A0ACC3T100_LIPKO
MFDNMSAVKASDSEPSSENNSPTNDPMNGGASSYHQDTEGPKSQPNVPLSKRIACVICRRRKLRCDGARPACGTCARLHHNCVYEETRRKSGPKRGYVKMLEERLAHVEGLLNKKGSTVTDASPHVSTPASATSSGPQTLSDIPSVQFPQSIASSPAQNPLIGAPQAPLSAQQSVLPNEFGAIDLGGDFDFATVPTGNPGANIFELIALGMDEPLPPQSMLDELHTIYFEGQHVYLPMIHRPRYMASLNYPPNLQPPLYLRYAIWTLAASMSSKYRPYAAVFYSRARKYLEQVQMRGYGESIVVLPFTQAWILVSMYEYKVMYFPRAWLSSGIASRSALMLQTNKLDSATPSAGKQCLPPPADFIELEERRRTFWGAFCADRYASVGTGWPLTIDEIDIATNLPVSDAAFDAGVEETTCALATALNPTGTKAIRKMSVFAAYVLVVAVFGRIHSHLHRGEPASGEGGAIPPNFFERFRSIDNTIHSIMLALPNHVKRPMGPMSPTSAQLLMSVHATSICLHQATIFRTRRSPYHQSEFETSKQRCLQAASEITAIMQGCSHFDMSALDAFMSFCVYIAARCFVQALRTSPDGLDPGTRSRLDFLLTALDNMKDDMPIAQSFLLQLEVDMANLLDEESEAMVDCRVPKLSPSSILSMVSDSEMPSDISQTSPSDDAAPYLDSGSIGHGNAMKAQKKNDSAGPHSREKRSPDAAVGVNSISDVPGVWSWKSTSTGTSTSGNDVEMMDSGIPNSNGISISTLSHEVFLAARQQKPAAGHAEAVGINSLTSAYTAQPLDSASASPDAVLRMQLNELEDEQQQLFQLHDQAAQKTHHLVQQQQVLQHDEQLRRDQQPGMGTAHVNGLGTLGQDIGVCGTSPGRTTSSDSPKPWTPPDMAIATDFSLTSYLRGYTPRP